MTHGRFLAVAMVAASIGGAFGSGAEQTTLAAPAGPRSVKLPIEGKLASFAGATSWLNSPPLTPAGLRGRVVLVDFWTLTCVNWLRTLPYVRAWVLMATHL